MLEAVVAGLFGLLIGSFLNVCIYRMPRDLSVVHPRSFCPNCEHSIGWFDNVPVVTWFLLRGRCRHCRGSIPYRYPLVEALTAFFFYLAISRLGLNANGIRLCIFAAIQVALIFMDLEERILADEFTLGGTVVGLIFAWFVPIPVLFAHLVLSESRIPQYGSIVEALLGAGVTSALLWSIGTLYKRFRHREGLGFGDVKMMMMVGAFVGLQGALMTLIIASLAGSVIGLLFIWLSRKDTSYEIPLGSFIGGAALLVGFTHLAIP